MTGEVNQKGQQKKFSFNLLERKMTDGVESKKFNNRKKEERGFLKGICGGRGKENKMLSLKWLPSKPLGDSISPQVTKLLQDHWYKILMKSVCECLKVLVSNT